MNDPSVETPGRATDEADLVERSRGGDLDAFNKLVELHQRLVYNLCLRMLGRPPAAEDATQETFFSAFRNINSFTGANFRAWLMRIAGNICIDELRKRSRRSTASLDEPSPITGEPLEVGDPTAGPEVEAMRGEQRRSIEAALLRLPPDQRLAVVMCDVQGFSYEEIALATRASLGTVKSRIARGREKLRRELGPTNEGTIGGG